MEELNGVKCKLFQQLLAITGNFNLVRLYMLRNNNDLLYYHPVPQFIAPYTITK